MVVPRGRHESRSIHRSIAGFPGRRPRRKSTLAESHASQHYVVVRQSACVLTGRASQFNQYVEFLVSASDQAPQTMKSFSQRKGLKPVAEVAQIGTMNDELRNSLWNALDAVFWSSDGFLYGRTGGYGEIEEFSRILWADYFKKRIDSRPGHGSSHLSHLIVDEIQVYFFSCEWNEVYDLLEFLVRVYRRAKPRLPGVLNQVLARELAGYKFIDGTLVDITDPQESQMLAEALADTRFAPVTSHLHRALGLLADRKQPDYRNSIKESISAVEAMARIVSENPKATLGEALKVLERKGHLHPALKDGFSKLYGYTNDDDGIRHAMLEEPDLDQSDAQYFLLSCTSFINYLKANLV